MPATMLFIGRERIEVADLIDAQRVYCQRRDESGEGASTFPIGRVFVGKVAYTISYNGRAWDVNGVEVGRPSVVPTDEQRAWRLEVDCEDAGTLGDLFASTEFDVDDEDARRILGLQIGESVVLNSGAWNRFTVKRVCS
jgi:hypothetical protein